MDLTVYYQNTRGLRTKTHDFFSSTNGSSYGIICISETWLNNGVHNGELFNLNAFSVYRRDRDAITTSKVDGGGVMIAVRNSYSSRVHVDWSNDGICEDIWVSIDLNGKQKLLVCCVYVPPYASAENISCHLDKVSNVCMDHPEDLIMIVGDYNIPQVSWSYNETLNMYDPSSATSSVAENVIDTYSLLNFGQYNGVANTFNKTLDLLFSSTPNVQVTACTTPFVPQDNHHVALDVVCNVNNLAFKCKASYKKFNFRNCDYDAINNVLQSVDWDILLRNTQTDIAVSMFYDCIQRVVQTHVHEVPVRRTYPSWYSRNTIMLIKQKSKTHKRWKRYKNLADYVTFSNLRREVKDLIKNDYNMYIAQTESSMRDNIKNFWSFISNKKNQKAIPDTVIYNNSEYSEDTVCTAFNEYFSSVYVADNALPSVSPVLCYNSILIERITEEEIRDAIDNLNPNKSCGPDNIPSLFVKCCKLTLVKPLCMIYNKMLSEGIFPTVWKIGHVVPIYKSGDKSNVSNYRPITLLSVFGKIFEAILTAQLSFYLKHQINEHQHGFIKNRSVVTNLTPFVQYVYDVMDERAQVDAIYTDFSKAFDKVDHATLLVKLQNVGLYGNLLNLIKSYLSGRVQCVKLNNRISEYVNVPSGVPQGSHLGPLLFSIFINDIGTCFKSSQYSLYADDLKIYKRIDTVQDCIALQGDIDRFVEYCNLNKLVLNISKCSFITFSRLKGGVGYRYTISDSPLQHASFVKDLGVVLDSKLSFDLHIESVVKKALKNLGFVFRSTKGFTSYHSLFLLYNSLVRSHLEYACVVWYPAYNKYISRIENVQIKFLNYVNYRYNRFLHFRSYEQKLCFYKVQKLSSRRIISSLLLLYNLLTSKIDCPELLFRVNFNIKAYVSRSNNLFYNNMYITNASLNSPVSVMLRNYDRFFSHLDLFNCSIHNLKRVASSVFT